jgi:separase
VVVACDPGGTGLLLERLVRGADGSMRASGARTTTRDGRPVGAWLRAFEALIAEAVQHAASAGATAAAVAAAATEWSDTEKEMWWRAREQLDERLGAWLRAWQADVLGPWATCLLLPSASADPLALVSDAMRADALGAPCGAGAGLDRTAAAGGSGRHDDDEDGGGVRWAEAVRGALGAAGADASPAAVAAALARIRAGLTSTAGAAPARSARAAPDSAAAPAPDWAKLTVERLRQAAAARGLSTAGRKADLVARLTAHVDDEAPASSPGRGTMTAAGEDGALVLALSEELLHVPWEALPCLRGRRVTRVPCPSLLLAQHARPWALGAGLRRGALRGRFVLNPAGDLPRTEVAVGAVLRGPLRGAGTWRGWAGVAPSADEYATALSESDVLLYCGHGAGEALCPRDRLAGGLARAPGAVWLMGCSSGRMRPHNWFDPTGTVAALLVAGAPAVVANLWDVTDRDIDRFTAEALERWLGTTGDAPGQRWLEASVGAARTVCRLPHLTGAAPVVYGVPLASE